MTGLPVLAIDIGGTKIMAALVAGDRLLDQRNMATDRATGPDVWLDELGELVRDWSGHYGLVGITVTGLVKDGLWRGLSSETLNIHGDYPIAARAEAMFGRKATLLNDAQAAAWGEYAHGAGAGRDMVFLTVSTGVGGGIISGGRLLTGRAGLAGHVGLLQPLPEGTGIFEDGASGRFIAQASGQPDARAAFAAMDMPAQEAIDASARRIGTLCHNLQLLTDPDVIVIGGGVGLAPGYLQRVEGHLAHLAPLYRPTLTAAALGSGAGVIGIAALAQQEAQQRGPT